MVLKSLGVTLRNLEKPLPTESICLAVNICGAFNRLGNKIVEDVRRCRNHVDSLGDNRQYEKRLIANRIGAIAATIKSAAFLFDAVDCKFFRTTEYEAVNDFYNVVQYAEEEMRGANLVAGMDETSFDVPHVGMVKNMLVYLREHYQTYTSEKNAVVSKQQWIDMVGAKGEAKITNGSKM